ncbi:MAG: prolipoprotein diacylglyceryltransferase [Halobacteriales archaeon]|jgi:prolipoprotein diacylglyceryltransferase
MDEVNKTVQGTCVLLFAIYCSLWAVFLNVLSLTSSPQITITAQKIMVLSLPFALIGIAWPFWPVRSGTGDGE